MIWYKLFVNIYKKKYHSLNFEDIFLWTTLFLRQSLEIGISWSKALEIEDSWSKDLCVYLQSSNYIEFYNRTVNN